MRVRAVAGLCAVLIGTATLSGQSSTTVSDTAIADEVATRIVLESAFSKRIRAMGTDILIDHPDLTLEERIGWGLVMQQTTDSQELIDSSLQLAVATAQASSPLSLVEAELKAMAIRNSVLTEASVDSSGEIELVVLGWMTPETAATIVKIASMPGVAPIVEAWRAVRATAVKALAASPDAVKSFASAHALKARVASDELKQARRRVVALIAAAKQQR